MLAATKSYLELVKKVPLRPIESDQELDRAIATIDALLAKPALSRDEDDYLDVLGDLVHKYERTSQSFEPVPDSVMLQHLMEAKATSRADIHKATGIPVSAIGAVLQGKRDFSREQVTIVSDFFHVAPSVFALPKSTASEKKGSTSPPRSQRVKAPKLKKNRSR